MPPNPKSITLAIVPKVQRHMRGLLDSLKTTVDVTTVAPPPSLDGWHDIEDFDFPEKP